MSALDVESTVDEVLGILAEEPCARRAHNAASDIGAWSISAPTISHWSRPRFLAAKPVMRFRCGERLLPAPRGLRGAGMNAHVRENNDHDYQYRGPGRPKGSPNKPKIEPVDCSSGVAAQELKQFVERVERLEEEKKNDR